MQYIVFDLEATCWPKPHTEQSEIIEIGAVRIDRAGRAAGEFSAFVRPTCHPVLSDFCRELTTIHQDQVDQAAPFPVVLEDFLQWIREGGEAWLLCSWGFYDKKQLTADCALHGLDTTWLEPHISIKHRYAELHQLRRPPGMAAALKREGLELTGTHHRGIDDARNIARIFVRHMEALVW